MIKSNLMKTTFSEKLSRLSMLAFYTVLAAGLIVEAFV